MCPRPTPAAGCRCALPLSCPRAPAEKMRTTPSNVLSIFIEPSKSFPLLWIAEIDVGHERGGRASRAYQYSPQRKSQRSCRQTSDERTTNGWRDPMTWIKTIPFSEADEKLRDAIERQRALHPPEYGPPTAVNPDSSAG